MLDGRRFSTMYSGTGGLGERRASGVSFFWDSSDTTNISEKKKLEAAALQKFSLTAELNPMPQIEKDQERLSLLKSRSSLGRLSFLGFIAGLWIALGSILSTVIAGGIPDGVRADWPMLPRMISALMTPCGIIFCQLLGGELFTTNIMTMTLGLMAKRITPATVLINWGVVLLWNFIGCVFFVYFFGYQTGLFLQDPWSNYTTTLAETKINMPPQVAFFRAVAGNSMIGICILLGGEGRDMIGKLLAMWFPIVVCGGSGYEHAVANMADVPMGLMYGANASAGKWFYQNLILTILGNIIGGGAIMAGFTYYLYDWKKIAAPPPAPAPAPRAEAEPSCPAGSQSPPPASEPQRPLSRLLQRRSRQADEGPPTPGTPAATTPRRINVLAARATMTRREPEPDDSVGLSQQILEQHISKSTGQRVTNTSAQRSR